MLEELLPQIEEDKSEEEIRHIIKRFLIEKGITQHLTENQIRAICWQYLIGNVSGDDSGGNGSSSVTPVFPTTETYNFINVEYVGFSGDGPPSGEAEINTYYLDTQNNVLYRYQYYYDSELRKQILEWSDWVVANNGISGYYLSISNGGLYRCAYESIDFDLGTSVCTFTPIELDDDAFLWVDKTNVTLLINKDILSKVAEWGDFIYYLFYTSVEGISIVELFMPQYDEPLYNEVRVLY